MSREQSDGKYSVVVTGDGPVDDGTAETEVNFRLPRGSYPGPDRVPMDMPIAMGAVGAEAVTPDPGQTRRLGPLIWTKPKRHKYELPIQPTPGPGRLVPGAGIQPATDRFAFEMPTLTYPGPGRQLPGTGTQPVTDWFAYKLLTLPTLGQGRLPQRTSTQPVLDRLMDDPSNMPNAVPGYDRLPPRTEVCDSHRSPEPDLMDTVAHLQLEVEALKFVQSGPSTLHMKTLPVQSKPVAFTSTNVQWVDYLGSVSTRV